ncbi:MAG: branched-chain amino acid ABC transporter permease [Christensenellaceae bacterium]|nr:branched-chain amino acid ABC transporter permease [Christensenellaceae bacterium]
MHKTKRETKIVIFVMVFIAAVMPFILGTKNNYFINILISYCYYGIMAMSLNLLVGYTGQISLGHGAFMAIGGYTYAILTKTLGWHFLPAIFGSLVLTFLLGLLIGLASCKLHAIFLAMTTLGFSKVVSLIIINEGWLTGGANGFVGIKKLTVFGHRFMNYQLYFVALALTLMVALICYRLIYSKTGRAFQAIRTAPIAAASMGINVNGYKFLVCGISAAMAGLAGCIYALNINYLSADIFDKSSILLLTMTVVGGMGSLFGPIIGTLVIGTLPELLRPFAEYLDGIYGVVIILVVLFMPHGIYGGMKSLIDRKRKSDILSEVTP